MGYGRYFSGSSNDVFDLGDIGNYGNVRILGVGYKEANGIMDVSIYGNGGSPITARGNIGNGNTKPKLYLKGRRCYIQVPLGLSNSMTSIGGDVPLKTSLPSEATELTITAY